MISRRCAAVLLVSVAFVALPVAAGSSLPTINIDCDNDFAASGVTRGCNNAPEICEPQVGATHQSPTPSPISRYRRPAHKFE